MSGHKEKINCNVLRNVPLNFTILVYKTMRQCTSDIPVRLIIFPLQTQLINIKRCCDEILIYPSPQINTCKSIINLAKEDFVQGKIEAWKKGMEKGFMATCERPK